MATSSLRKLCFRLLPSGYALAKIISRRRLISCRYNIIYANIPRLSFSTSRLKYEAAANAECSNIIRDTERAQGTPEKLEFQTETKKLLDIVAKSLYSDKEVFIRELISNGSDALEKQRHMQMTDTQNQLNRALEIHIATDAVSKTFTIQDTGIGMTKEEMIDNLGTICRSGTKDFLEFVKQHGMDKSIIGQFGVGFYSAFVVSDKVEVYSLSSKPDSPAFKWSSDGLGTYEISQAEGVQPGTKVVLHLKQDCTQYCEEHFVKDVIKKYSNFINSPIFLNGKRTNIVQALWMQDAKQITDDMHKEFFRFITNSPDFPRFSIPYKTDYPINLNCLLYIPEGRPGLFELGQPDLSSGISLYSNRVLIKNKADILPQYMRFVKGIIDSEDIPLNLSRELLQEGALIRKIKRMVTSYILRSLEEKMNKSKDSYLHFYQDYSVYLKEGIITTHEQQDKEEIARLLMFESSATPPGEKISLTEYCSRMKEDQREILYMVAPSRQIAETSPYFEVISKKDLEVLFCYEIYDEAVFLKLTEFNRNMFASIEKKVKSESEIASAKTPEETDQLSDDDKSLIDWLAKTLSYRVQKVKVSKHLSAHPCLVTINNIAEARCHLRTPGIPDELKYKAFEPTLELNMGHPIIKKLSTVHKSDPKLASLLAEQLFQNAMVAAGLVDDPRRITGNLNELLSLLVEKC